MYSTCFKMCFFCDETKDNFVSFFVKMYVQVDFRVYGIASLKAFLHLFLSMCNKRMLGFFIFQVQNNLMH